MNDKILQDAGLTKSQARAYIELVKHNPCPPPKLAEYIEESRTNTYKLLEQLEEIGLVSRDKTAKKLRYWANNPSVLNDLIKKRRLSAEEAEKRFNDSLPTLMNEYFDKTERPSVQYFHGPEGIKKLFDDQIETGKPVMFIEAVGSTDFFSLPIIHNMRNLFPKNNIERRVISRDTPYLNVDPKNRTPIDESDKKMLLNRTWIDENDYTAPVEWSVYGDKISIISFGEEAMGVVIKSPQIASSFRQIFGLMEKSISSAPGYRSLPKKLLYTKKPLETI